MPAIIFTGQQLKTMKKTIYILASLIVMLTSFTSCLKGDDTEVVYYNDTAITSVVLGTMKRTVHTTSSKGVDSTYFVTFAGSRYPMFIDQAKNLIYNADSLPKGTNKKMLITVSALNSSYVFVKSLTSDSLSACSSGDSIDFSQPRQLRVMSSDGSAHRDYNMEVRIHNEEKDIFNWFRFQDSDALASLAGMRGMSVGNKLFVYGVRKDGVAKAVYTSDISDGNTWTMASEILAGNAELVNDGKDLYALSAGQILKSADGATWSHVADAANIKHLLGATKSAFYGVDANGIVASTDGCLTWHADAMDDNASYLPTEDINALCMPLATNDDLEKIFVVGRRDAAQYGDSKAVIWSKIDGEKMVEEQQGWIHQDYGRDNSQTAPALEHLTVVPYNGAMILVGGNGTGNCTVPAFDKLLCSYDQGITWRTDKRLSLPTAFSSNENSFALITDKNNFLWIIAGTTGQVWRGTFTQMQWEQK